MLHVRRRWLFRPGDLVQVQLTGPGAGKGFYVPMQAIRPEGGGHFVFLVRPDASGTPRARRVRVRIAGEIGQRRRIASEDLADGAEVILHGADQVIDGEPVRVVGQEGRAP